MFLKRELGYVIYFLLILVDKIALEVINDGLELSDFSEIIPFTMFATLIINIILYTFESLASLKKNGNIKFWRYFNLNTSITIFIILLIIPIIFFLLTPNIDDNAIFIWIVIVFFGEIMRIYYNFKISKS